MLLPKNLSTKKSSAWYLVWIAKLPLSPIVRSKAQRPVLQAFRSWKTILSVVFCHDDGRVAGHDCDSFRCCSCDYQCCWSRFLVTTKASRSTVSFEPFSEKDVQNRLNELAESSEYEALGRTRETVQRDRVFIHWILSELSFSQVIII